MKKISFFIVIIASIISLYCVILYAADINKTTDEFYLGLALIIEHHMDNPQACVQAVEAYYQENQSTIQKIRTSAQEALEKSGPMMEKMMNNYMTMSEEELEELEKQQKGSMTKAASQSSPGVDRYTKALQNFTMRNPQQGMRIATKALELVPCFDSKR